MDTIASQLLMSLAKVIVIINNSVMNSSPEGEKEYLRN
jgi:hypothetical protein